MAGQAGAIGAGPFDPDALHGPETGQPARRAARYSPSPWWERTPRPGGRRSRPMRRPRGRRGGCPRRRSRRVSLRWSLPSLSWVKGWHAPARSDLGRPSLCERHSRSNRLVGAGKNPGTRPTRRLERQPEQASAGSKVRPGPRAPDPTSYPPAPRGCKARTTTNSLPGTRRTPSRLPTSFREWSLVRSARRSGAFTNGFANSFLPTRNSGLRSSSSSGPAPGTEGWGALEHPADQPFPQACDPDGWPTRALCDVAALIPREEDEPLIVEGATDPERPPRQVGRALVAGEAIGHPWARCPGVRGSC